MSQLFKNSVFQAKPLCHNLVIPCAYFLHEFLSVYWFADLLLTVVRTGRMETNVFRYLLPFHSAAILFLSIDCLFSSFKISRVFLLHTGLQE